MESASPGRCARAPGVARWTLNLMRAMVGHFAAGPSSELVDVLLSLERHWRGLEGEVVEIGKEIQWCRDCLHKHGSVFQSPLEYLLVWRDWDTRITLSQRWAHGRLAPQAVRQDKVSKMQDIVRTMESFESNMRAGKRLVNDLNGNKVGAARTVPVSA